MMTACSPVAGRLSRLLVHGRNEFGLATLEPRGAFYAFPSVQSTRLTLEDFAERLLMEERGAVVPGNAFGPSGHGDVPCGYATSTAGIAEALDRMRRFMGRL